MEQIDITKKTLTELEAMAYQEIVKSKICQNNLSALEQQILKKRNEQNKPIVETNKEGGQ